MNKFFQFNGLKYVTVPQPDQSSLTNILFNDFYRHPDSGAKCKAISKVPQPVSKKKKLVKSPKRFYTNDELRTLHLIQKRANLNVSRDPTFSEFTDRLALDCEKLPLHLTDEVIARINLDIDVLSDRLKDLAQRKFQKATQEDIAACIEVLKIETDQAGTKLDETQKAARELLNSHHINPDMAKTDAALAYVDIDHEFERNIRDGFVYYNARLSDIPWAHSDLSLRRMKLGSNQTQTHPDTIAEMLGFQNFRALYDAIAGKTVLDLGSGANTLAKAIKLLDNETGTNTTVISVNPYGKVPLFLTQANIVDPQNLGVAITDKSTNWSEQFAEIDKSTVDDYWTKLKSVNNGSVDVVISIDSFPKLVCSHTESKAALKEIVRVLKPGGKFYVSPVFSNNGTTGAKKVVNKSSGSPYSINIFTNEAYREGLTSDGPWLRFDDRKIQERAGITGCHLVNNRYAEGEPIGLVFKKTT